MPGQTEAWAARGLSDQREAPCYSFLLRGCWPFCGAGVLQRMGTLASVGAGAFLSAPGQEPEIALLPELAEGHLGTRPLLLWAQVPIRGPGAGKVVLVPLWIICSGCHDKAHEWLKQQTFISSQSGGWTSETKVLTAQVSSEAAVLVDGRLPHVLAWSPCVCLCPELCF